MSADNHDAVAQLQAKVAMLSAALRKMDTDRAQKAIASAMLSVDCAYAFTQYAEWNRALFVAMETLSRSDVYSPLTSSLVEIGGFLAEEAIAQAEGFGSDAEKIMDSCKKAEF